MRSMSMAGELPAVLKLYQVSEQAGGEAGFWENNWREGSLDETIRYCSVDPMLPIFRQYLPKGGLVLEGGCGMGHYVVFYRREGYRMVGLDFAQETVHRLKSAYANSPVTVGNVERLPFPDNCFEAYYSGGVVEHFEDGPRDALREAHRVLKPNAPLIITVPNLNMLRRIRHSRFLSAFPHRKSIDQEKLTFWQYAFGVKEFADILNEVGFRVVFMRPMHILWGFYEIPMCDRLVRGIAAQLKQRHEPTVSTREPSRSGEDSSAKKQEVQNRIHSYIKNAFVSENDKCLPVVLPLLRTIAGNLTCYVCYQK